MDKNRRLQAQSAEVIPMPFHSTRRRHKLALAKVAIMFSAACAGTDIIKADGDTYFISSTGSMLPSSSPPTSQASYVLKRAKGFCEQRNQEVEVVKLDGRVQSTFEPASARLHFRCVD
jgi:hypothetical protein